MLSAAIANTAARHKAIAEQLIDTSTIEVIINVKDVKETPSTGSSMFADMDGDVSSIPKGPFKVLWVDADSARVSFSRDANLIARYTTAEVVAKFKLEDVLVDIADPYGQTYLDKALNVTLADRKFQVLGYDRYGLGVVSPYLIAVALRGGYDE